MINDDYGNVVKYLNKLQSMDFFNKIDDDVQFPAVIKKCQSLLNQIISEEPLLEQMHVISSSNVIRNLDVLFENMICRCANQDQLHKFNTTLLQNSIEIVGILVQSFDQLVKNLALHNTIAVSANCFSVAESTLHIIYVSYDHCQSSEKCYGANFSSVSNLLGELFRKTFGLQKVFTVMLNKFTLPNNEDNETAAFRKICGLLLDISVAVKDMDNTLVGSTWKLLVSCLVKFKPALLEQIDIMSFVKEILKNGENLSDQCKIIVKDHSGDFFSGDIELLKSVAVLLRMTGFFFSLLTTLTSEYIPQVDEDKAILFVDFLCKITENLLPLFVVIPGPSNHILPSALRKVLCGHVLKEIDKYISSLAATRTFKSRVFICDKDKSRSPAVQVLLILRLIKCVLHRQCCFDLYNVDAQGKSDSKLCVFGAVFHLQNELYPHLMQSALCFIDDEIQFPYLTSVISAHMSACVSHMPSAHCNHLEDMLLTNLTSANPYKFMLASDLLCQLARCSSSGVLEHYVKFFTEAVNSFDLARLSLRQVQVGSALRRVFALLPHDRQTALMSKCWLSDDKNANVWYFVGSCFLSTAIDRRKHIQDLSEFLRSLIVNWFDNGSRLADLPALVSGLLVFAAVLRPNNESDYAQVPIPCKSEVQRLWTNLPSSNEQASNSLAALYASLAYATSRLAGASLDQQDVLPILHSANAYLSSFSGVESEATTLHSFVQLLTATRAMHLSSEATHLMTSLWKRLLDRLTQTDNWLLRHMCLDGFEAFSRMTKHPDVVRRICCDNFTIGAMVKSHLKRVIEPLADNLNLMALLIAPNEDPSLNLSSTEACSVVQIIEEAVQSLRGLPYSTLNDIDKTSIKNTILILQRVLSS